MHRRITLVSMLKREDILKIETILHKINKLLCKVPFGKGVEDRFVADTLPYHFTIYSWNIEMEKEIIFFLKSIEFPKLELTINRVDIMSGNENSYVLYFGIEKNPLLLQLQDIFYQQFGSEYYNPNHFEFHITLHITKDREEIIKMKQIIEKEFEPFSLEISQFGLYEIYPAELLYHN